LHKTRVNNLVDIFTRINSQMMCAYIEEREREGEKFYASRDFQQLFDDMIVECERAMGLNPLFPSRRDDICFANTHIVNWKNCVCMCV
jgi:hypothetical protein